MSIVALNQVINNIFADALAAQELCRAYIAQYKLPTEPLLATIIIRNILQRRCVKFDQSCWMYVVQQTITGRSSSAVLSHPLKKGDAFDAQWSAISSITIIIAGMFAKYSGQSSRASMRYINCAWRIMASILHQHMSDIRRAALPHTIIGIATTNSLLRFYMDKK